MNFPQILNFRKTYNQGPEKGRTLVEVLGVLAVIGVLSVSGFYGFSFLKGRYQNNQLLNEANARAVAVSTKMLAGSKVVGLGGFSSSFLGHEIRLTTVPSGSAASAFATSGSVASTEESAQVKAGDSEFALEISNVTKELCHFFEKISSEQNVVSRIEDENGKVLSCDSKFSEGSIASNGSPIQINIYLIYKSDMSVAASTTGTDSGTVDSGDTGHLRTRKDLCGEHGDYIADGENGLEEGCACDVGFEGEKCATKTEEGIIVCSGHGRYFVPKSTKQPVCLCDEGYERGMDNSSCVEKTDSDVLTSAQKSFLNDMVEVNRMLKDVDLNQYTFEGAGPIVFVLKQLAVQAREVALLYDDLSNPASERYKDALSTLKRHKAAYDTQDYQGRLEKALGKAN